MDHDRDMARGSSPGGAPGPPADAEPAAPSGPPSDAEPAAPSGPRTGAVQDFYAEDYAHCYGCGRLNPHGLRFKTYWHDEGRSITRFQPEPHHTALPGIVYGGLIAALIDCHSTGTAAAALYHAEDRDFDTEPPVRCVTAGLHVDYVRPTPIDGVLEVRGWVKELKGKKVVVVSTLTARGEVCARGEVVAIRVSESGLRG